MNNEQIRSEDEPNFKDPNIGPETIANEVMADNDEDIAAKNNETEPLAQQFEKLPNEGTDAGTANSPDAALAEAKDKYLRIFAEFENFRRRTAKEKTELVKTAGEGIVTALLPVLDDFERALKSFETASDVEALKEGIALVHGKFTRVLEAKGLKPMDAKGKAFDAEVHEAIAQIPAPTEDQKGKVIDELEKGYLLNDKAIRFAKVVIGS